MTPLHSWLSEVEARLKGATPGPWIFERAAHDSGEFSYERNDDHALIALYETNFEKPMKAKFDSDFIAHSREDLERAVKVIREMEQVLITVKTDIERRMKSDDACDHPFDEDLADALKKVDEILGKERE